MKHLVIVISFVISLCFLIFSRGSDTIYVQASKGSFNDAAIHQLFERDKHLQAELNFSGTPINTFMNAHTHGGYAFTAVENSSIDGRLVPATVEALKSFQIEKVIAKTTMPIEMCVLSNRRDVENNIGIRKIASHPAALKQILRWKSAFSPEEIEVPEGTASAAEKVALSQLPQGTAAIGPCILDQVYKGLVVVERGIQDNKDNQTTFLLMHVKPRDKNVSEPEVRNELRMAIERG
ncbi:prephenate dehydratase domain-containing protein [Vibrio caribbeanicus]|uniref:prephenate dehydratase domain-containing protein n=1 Tax=Vibrio caribbeanicus TaxID=701175 RepID=UPI0022839506|nr:prephenate dehydratase domain-containing protein [Vibrio caribbeanicus]MCY9844017.1 prephenate dehydratase [Vibrio caribbeanicus]